MPIYNVRWGRQNGERGPEFIGSYTKWEDVIADLKAKHPDFAWVSTYRLDVEPAPGFSATESKWFKK